MGGRQFESGSPFFRDKMTAAPPYLRSTSVLAPLFVRSRKICTFAGAYRYGRTGGPHPEDRRRPFRWHMFNPLILFQYGKR